MKLNSFIFQFFCVLFLLAINSQVLSQVLGSVRTVFTNDKKDSANVSPVLSKKLRNNIINELKRKEPVSQSRASGSGFLVSTGISVGLQSSPNSQLIDRASLVALDLSQTVSKNLDENSPSSVLSNVRAPEHFCPFKQSFDCDPNALFRTHDGSCNNLQTPWWGKSEIPYKRYLKPSYKDGITEPRILGKSGNPLPNPRVISNKLFSDNKKTEDFYTLILPLFGQFLAHDIVSTAVTTDPSGQAINCPCNSINASCLSFDIPADEKIMKFSDCMSFTRSSAAFPTFDCTLGTREQLNLLSAFIDGSQVYGLNENRSLDLRLFHGGQLLFSESVAHKRHMLPTATDRQCKDTTEKIKCFGAGEGRTNENLGLLSLQTLFLREHNRIAKILTKLRPDWDDERIYQETRKIVTSIMQHITYNEFLPTILGWKAATLFDLTPLSTNNYYTGYNTNADPTIANEFATAAFRFGHTLIKNQFLRANNKNQKIGSVNLGEIIFRPAEAYNDKAGGLESILYGTINDAAGKFDTSFADTLQNHLFEIKDSTGAFAAVDLAATNINRGRDHGIPSYNSYRKKCGLSVARSFDDLKDAINPEALRVLSNLYEDVDDIDLYVGGLSEKSTQSAVVGPTFSCIIGNQFIDLKRGDRFYYENGPSITSFTLDQLREIKKVSLAGVLCENTDLIDIQPNVFLQPLQNLNNTRVPCNTIPRINFNIWND